MMFAIFFFQPLNFKLTGHYYNLQIFWLSIYGLRFLEINSLFSPLLQKLKLWKQKLFDYRGLSKKTTVHATNSMLVWTSKSSALTSGLTRKCEMSMCGDHLHSPQYLSWRKLHLSRAKLKASSKTSALLSGFAMVAMVELQLQNPDAIPSSVLVVFAVITTLLVAVHMLALMISTCILPNIEAICSLNVIGLVHESPHERLHWYIETAWAFSTLLGLLLFLAEIAILCWVKFYDINKTAAWSASVVLIPILFVFLAFAIHFYRSMVAHKYEMTVSGIRELERLKEQIEQGDVEHNRVNGELLGNTGVHIV